MMELTDKRLVSILWMLRNKNKKWSILELRKGTSKMMEKDDAVYSRKKPFPILNLALTYGPTFRFIKELEKGGYVYKDEKTQEYGVSKATDLAKFVSLHRPIMSLEAKPYFTPISFEKKLELIKNSKLAHAFTLFSGSELYRPYVKTEQVHAYIKETEINEWEKYLLSNECRKVMGDERSQANIFLIPTNQEVFFSQAEKVKGFSVAPLPILLSDLLSAGGLAEEQAKFLMEEWLEDRL